MSPISPVFALGGLALFVALGHALSLLTNEAPKAHRFQSVDGLRGYLAFAVFLHHAGIWYFYLRGDPWAVPPSNLYTHLGQVGVSVFFMITGLLFYSKILDSRGRSLDWLRLYVSRILRLTPLYLLACGVMLFFVGLLAHGTGNKEPPERIAAEIVQWLTFTLTGAPMINGVRETGTTLAHVVWSLQYEWLFYGCLPLAAFVAGVRASNVFLLLGIVSLIVLLPMGTYQPMHPANFLVGMIAAVLSRVHAVGRLSQSFGASVAVAISLVTAVSCYRSAYSIPPFLLISAAFVVIASGNSMWGSLTSRTSRALGELSYGIYLLHGLMLFTLFTFALPRSQARNLDPIWHWVASLGLTPILVLLSALAYRYVEKPAMDLTDGVTRGARSFAAKCGFATETTARPVPAATAGAAPP